MATLIGLVLESTILVYKVSSTCLILIVLLIIYVGFENFKPCIRSVRYAEIYSRWYLCNVDRLLNLWTWLVDLVQRRLVDSISIILADDKKFWILNDLQLKVS